MSLDDYNQGYQSGWTGVATGPPRSAAEFVGRWNGEDARRRAAVSIRAPASSSSDGGGNGHLVLAALFGAIASGLCTMSFLCAILGAVGGVAAMTAASWGASRVVRLLAWVFKPIPVLKIALLGGVGTLAVDWVLNTRFSESSMMGPVVAGGTGASTLLLIAAVLRIVLAPFFAAFLWAKRR